MVDKWADLCQEEEEEDLIMEKWVDLCLVEDPTHQVATTMEDKWVDLCQEDAQTHMEEGKNHALSQDVVQIHQVEISGEEVHLLMV
jgi:hypothetical protein